MSIETGGYTPKEVLTDIKAQDELEQPKQEAEKEFARVGEVCLRYNVFIVHGTDPNFVSPTGPLEAQQPIGWKEKIDKLINEASSLSLSCSTINGPNKETKDDQSKFWTPIGVILREGAIGAAFSKDAGSMKAADGSRVYAQSDQASAINQRIEEAITHRDKYYNELLVSDAEIAGIYFIIDSRTENQDRDQHLPRLGLKPLFDEAQARGVDLFLFYNGAFHRPIIVTQEFDYFIPENPDDSSGLDDVLLQSKMNPDDPYSQNYKVPVIADRTIGSTPMWLYEDVRLANRDEIEVFGTKGHWEKRSLQVVRLGDVVKVADIYR